MSVIFINPYRFAASSLLLDLFPNAAAAYSLRQLRTGVTSVVRVRRSSDNTEQDFTAAQVTDGTLTTFCDAGDGFVRTWYDQSENNRHVGQPTNANQLRIVNSGTVETDNGKPAIRSPSGYLRLSRAWNVSPVNPAVFSVKKYTQVYQANYSGHWVDIGNFSAANVFVSPISTEGPYVSHFSASRPMYGTTRRNLNTTYLESFRHSTGTGTLRINGALQGSNSLSLSTPANLLIGGSNSTWPATGYIQELIIYNDLALADVDLIELDLKTYYNIY